MHRRRLLAATLAALLTCSIPASTENGLGARQRGEDFDALWQAIDREYAYAPRDSKRLRASRAADRARAIAAADRDAFVAALEASLQRLRDEHVMLSERSRSSPRAVPGESDVWPAWQGGQAVVEAVRPYGDADVAGLRPGDRILRVDGVPVEQAVAQRLARGEDDPAARDWSLRHLVAGPRAGALRLEIQNGDKPRALVIERGAAAPGNGPPVGARRVGEARDLGYLRLRGRVDATLASHVEPALRSLRGTRALIVDLRDLHGDGGRASVEAILARFAPARAAWRIRESARGERATDAITPAASVPRGPILVLVDRWTAGDGEALAAGLAAVARARLVGTPMAGMRGELREIRLPHSGIILRFPAERVLHVDGTPRELLRPAVEVDLARPNGGPGDPILYQALKLLES